MSTQNSQKTSSTGINVKGRIKGKTSTPSSDKDSNTSNKDKKGQTRNKQRQAQAKPSKPKIDNPRAGRKTKPARSKIAKDALKVKHPISIPRLLGQELSKLWDVPAKYRNDNFIIDSISGVRNNDISKWPSLRIQHYRIVTNIDTKIKTSSPLETEDDNIRAFIGTQVEPILSPRVCKRVKSKIDKVFNGFPFQEILDTINSVDREFIITNGSAYPPLLAPVIGGINSNVDLIAGMAVGRDIYRSDFDINTVLYGKASGKYTLVPKNYKKSRGITITNREIISQQYILCDYLRDWITLWSRSSDHITQFDDQSVQHSLLIEGNATIDLSSASDRVYRSLVKEVWPEFYEYFSHLMPDDIITSKGNIIKLTCIGTQGYPLTFTLMSIIIGMVVSSAKLTKRKSANYGDDIIISEQDFAEVYTSLENVGLVINKDKTFKSSQGFLESCGQDIMFTINGPRNITPIYLRGTQDVDVIQFMHQLCNGGLISADNATSIMDKLGVKYYAFDNEFQSTRFHFPHGDIKNLPKPIWNDSLSHYVCSVPELKDEVTTIKGLSKSESADVLELIRIESGLKNPNNSRYFVRGVDPIARQYAIIDLQDSRLYPLYRALDTTEGHVPVMFYGELEEKYNVTFKALMYYRFITSELYKYTFSTATVDFSEMGKFNTTLQEFIDTSYGINSVTRYPIYRYLPRKITKQIFHPKTNEWILKRD